MTKIKNTKKGMAKKTLSISLVAAMLATSNVPVWADEFSDGTDAAFTSEAEAAPEVAAPETAAPEVQAEEAPVAQAEESKYTVSYKDVPSKVEWGRSASIKVKITDPQTESDVAGTMHSFAYISEEGATQTADVVGNLRDGYYSLDITSMFTAANVGKHVVVRTYEGDFANPTWYTESAPIEVAKQTLEGSLDFKSTSVADEAVEYTGKTITTVPKNATANNPSATYKFNGKPYSYTALIPSGGQAPDITLSDFTITGDDLVNSDAVSGKHVTATADIISKYYDGKFTVTYNIWRKELQSTNPDADDYVGKYIKVDFPKYNFQYTGNPVKVKVSDIKVTDLGTGKLVDNALYYNTEYIFYGTDVAEDQSAAVALKQADTSLFFTGSLANYRIDGLSNRKTVPVAGKYSITKRDLADTANTVIEISPVALDVVSNNIVSADGLKNNLTIKDADGSPVNKSMVSIDLGSIANQPLSAGKTYTVTVKPADGIANTKISGSRQVTFSVVAHDLNNEDFTPVSSVSNSETYTGEQITKGLVNLTSENFETKVGSFENKKLKAGVDYSTELEFGENKNAGTGQIIIKGLNSYAGTKKVLTFTINPRRATSVEVPEKILVNNANQDAEDYGIVPTVVAKFKDANGKEVKLTVPATDYTVKQTVTEGTNEGNARGVIDAGDVITTTVTKKANITGNFAFTELSGTTTVVNKSIADSDIKMNKTTYTYTGKEVALDYKVIVDGVELKKGVDYDETITGGKNVGDGILTIKGKGDYDNTTATAKFSIVPAKTSDLKIGVIKGQEGKVVYNGTQKKPAIGEVLSVTLNDVDVASEFVATYPTDKTANINVGKGQVTLTPKKGNKNFEGVQDFTFDITPETLSDGTLKLFNERNDNVTESNPSFKYDGTAHTFAKETYTNTVVSPKKLTSDDYEIRYAENVAGVSANSWAPTSTAYVFVVAKGNYKGNLNDGVVSKGVYTCLNGSKITNIVAMKTFTINRLPFEKDDIVVANGTYKGGQDVDPVVTVSYKGKKLVKDVDYTLTYDKSNQKNQDRKNVTNGKTLSVTISGKGGYYDSGDTTFNWGIDKFDFADADILVSGTDAAPVIKVMNGNILVPEKEYDLTVADGKVTVTATKDNKNYTGTKTVDIKHELEKPATPVLSAVNVAGNKATAVLSGECDGAAGYDYVISTDPDCITNKDYDKVNKNILKTQTDFTYVPAGTYYAYCHAWKRGEDGKKVFSEWSNAYPFVVTATTPAQPVITSVKVKGTTVTVTYTKAADATGYDVVLGTKVATVNGEKRPVEYGKLVKKNIKGNTVTATFKNVPKGTYYAGLHAFNRTNVDKTKVFSPWSNTKKVVVK